MQVFITGASGFIGTELVKQMVAAGHKVRGMVRSDEGAKQVEAAGAEVHRGDLTDLDSLRRGAAGMDAVVHLAFNHDFSKFAQSGQDEIKAIEALGAALKPGKHLVITSGTAVTGGASGHIRLESDSAAISDSIPRRPEQAGQAVAARGVHVSVVRLPQVHDTRKQGLVTYLTQIAREKGVSAYVGEGKNRWSAAPLQPVAELYRLVVEKAAPGYTVYHAVQEEGVPLKDIAEALAKGFNVPAKSISPEEALEHFGFLGHFAGLDMPASSEWTRKALGWNPVGPSLVEDLNHMQY